MEDLFVEILQALNETLTAGIVIIAASMLLYNLTRNLRNRIARTSAIVLACVTVSYVADVFVSLGPGPGAYEAALRLQWVGIAFLPAALMHLSDALLATTGLPSRGRRRRVIRILYLIAATFLVAAAFTNILIDPVNAGRAISLRPGFLFWLFLIYFVLAIIVTVINVQRARQRCLTRSTKRRMGYLQIAILTPSLGIFPYSVFPGIGEESLLPTLVLVNAANIVVIFMLLFLAYPLSFFGSRVPDRVVRSELLRFMLLGPATGMLALAVIVFINPATRILSLPGDVFMPFAVVAVVLLWQWSVALVLPWLEKRLIYYGEDTDQLVKLQTLSTRLLTRSDLLQLLEVILEASCDYIRVSTAFVAALNNSVTELVKVVGPVEVTEEMLKADQEMLITLLQPPEGKERVFFIKEWRSFWVVPLYSRRINDPTGKRVVIGLMGIEAQDEMLDFDSDEMVAFQRLVPRAARTLDDILLQAEVYAALEGLLPQYATTRSHAAAVEYQTGNVPDHINGLPDHEQMVEQVRAALRHYWGGTGLTQSGLQDLLIVQQLLPENEYNVPRALRAVLLEAIEQQKPEGQRKMTSPEWTLYNILQLRFVEKVKVREVANRLALSEPDLYRKQRAAIEVVTDTIIRMENEAIGME